MMVLTVFPVLHLYLAWRRIGLGNETRIYINCTLKVLRKTSSFDVRTCELFQMFPLCFHSAA